MKTGIFGGTFNPVHYGHLRAAEEVSELIGLDRVFFIPSGRPPFDKPDLADAEHRYNMLSIATKGNPYFIVSDIEMKRRGRSYTIDTLKRLRRRYRDDEFYLILGIDAFLDLPKWKDPDELITLTNIVIISRPGFGFVDLVSSPYLKGVSRQAMKGLDSGKRRGFSHPLSGDKEAIFCRVTGLEISASCIRGLIREGRSVRYLLPDSVKSYIISHKLYAMRDELRP
jgi:nicotinate-nucleotide adenylyltransferase